MAFLGATTAQLLSHWLEIRKIDREKTARARQVIRSMISDLDYASLFIFEAIEKIEKDNLQIKPGRIGAIYHSFSNDYFSTGNLISSGIYHRYSRPVGFAESVSKMMTGHEEFYVTDEFIGEAKSWARYCSYLADALESIADNTDGGNIIDYADYDPTLIEERMARGRRTKV